MLRNSFKRDNYVVLGTINKFCKKHNLGYISTKDEGLRKIEEFKKINLNNELIVKEWIEKTIRQGQKRIFLRKFEVEDIVKEKIYWKDKVTKSTVFLNEEQFPIDEPKIFNVQIEGGEEKVQKVYMDMGIKYKEILKNETRTCCYPIFVEIDFKYNLLKIRLKSKGTLYTINANNENGLGSSVNIFSLIENIQRKIESMYHIKLDSIEVNGRKKNIFHQVYFKILEEFTKTPKIIQDKIDGFEDEINRLVGKAFHDYKLNPQYLSNAKEDLKIFMEKYISLSEMDENIFKYSKEGYPIKLSATDVEETKVEEVSSDKTPLQKKSSFFDHKKIIIKQKSCDGMTLAYKRRDDRYFGKELFAVDFYYKKGNGIVNFPEYVEEADIENVLSNITRNI
ncbi:MAG: hypothetical protein RSE41_08475 [Clostridia bacterium]